MPLGGEVARAGDRRLSASPPPRVRCDASRRNQCREGRTLAGAVVFAVMLHGPVRVVERQRHQRQSAGPCRRIDGRYRRPSWVRPPPHRRLRPIDRPQAAHDEHRHPAPRKRRHHAGQHMPRFHRVHLGSPGCSPNCRNRPSRTARKIATSRVRSSSEICRGRGTSPIARHCRNAVVVMSAFRFGHSAPGAFATDRQPCGSVCRGGCRHRPGAGCGPSLAVRPGLRRRRKVRSKDVQNLPLTPLTCVFRTTAR